MKALKTIAAAGLLAGGLAGLASANSIDHVYIAGAPAYRQDSIATIDAVVKTFSGAGETASTSGTSDYSNASAVQWYIPNYVSGTDLIVNASFTGSTAGVESVASGSITQKFIANGTGSIASPVFGQTAGTAYQPDFTLSDTFQATTPFNGTVKLQTGASSFATYTFAALSQTKLGIEPYRFLATQGLKARGVTNITTAEAQALYKYGQLPLSFFTGKSSDETSYVYGLTRDPGSGSRLILQAETGVGVKTLLQTYKPTVTGGAIDSNGNNVNGTITDAPYNPNTGSGGPNLYPAGLISSLGVYDPNAGDTGYPKFGTTDTTGLLSAITATVNDPNAFYIAYFNNSDSTEAEANGAEELTYNGVAYSLAGVQEGQYTFWSYESIFPSATIAGNQLSFANAVKAAFPSHSSAPLSGVNVSRQVDGGPLSTLY
jgi:hypothetical protein